MREIEFRAWDKIENRMRYSDDVEGIKEWPSLLAVGFHGLPICVSADSFKNDEIIGWNRDHNLIIMQYTGLKDKNGKKIFEGDILKCKHGVEGEVYWAENWAMWAVWGESLIINIDGCIIGNIHETTVGENDA